MKIAPSITLLTGDRVQVEQHHGHLHHIRDITDGPSSQPPETPIAHIILKLNRLYLSVRVKHRGTCQTVGSDCHVNCHNLDRSFSISVPKGPQTQIDGECGGFATHERYSPFHPDKRTNRHTILS